MKSSIKSVFFWTLCQEDKLQATQKSLFHDGSEMGILSHNYNKVTCICLFIFLNFLTLKCLWNFKLKILIPFNEL